MPDAPAPRTPDDATAASADDLRDRALIARVSRGDDAAFEQLVRLHRPRLLRIGERIVDGGRAEDAVQVALLRAYEAFRRGTIPEQPSAWLSAATRNAAIDQHRRRGPVDPVAQPDASDAAPSVAAVAESRAELRRVLGDVAALPPNERDALLMRATSGAGHEAIGAHLDVSPGQARQLLHRARRRLREVAAILLPTWLALRVSQARAAMANVAAAPSDSLLATKGAAVVIAAAASVGGGSAALYAHRTTSDRPATPAAPHLTAEATTTSASGTPAATTLGPTRVRTATTSHADDTSRSRSDAAARDAGHAASDADTTASEGPRSDASTPNAATPTAPTTSTTDADANDRGDAPARKPSSSSSAASNGSSGSSSGGSTDSSSSGSSGAGSSGSSGSSSSGSGSPGSGSSDDDHADDAPSSASTSTAPADDDASDAESDDHVDDSEEATGRSEEVE